MTHHATLQLRLIDDVVISARSASTGGHQSLDYIPGATLLGYAASKLYTSLSKNDAYLAFHSGKIRFNNALPATKQGEVTYPMPLSWHIKKSGTYKPKSEKKLKNKHVFNFIHQDDFGDENKNQPKQIRNGYITTSGILIKPTKTFFMKTAIDSNTGTAKEAQLFGYESLTAGQCFSTNITADADIDEALFNKIINVLNGELYIGRSKSTEYGRINASVNEKSDTTIKSENKGTTLILWLLSDLALQDEYGQPTLIPDKKNIGINNAKWKADKSFIRTRSYAPYNAKYCSFDLERPVISQGSILYYELTSPLSDEELSKLSNGLGLWQQTGLGAIWVNPDILNTLNPNFKEYVTAETNSNNIKPDSKLISWLESQQTNQNKKGNDRKIAYKYSGDLSNLYKVSAELVGQNGKLVCPNSTQWGRILELSKNNFTQNKIKEKMFLADDKICKGEDWEAEIEYQKKRQPFYSWLESIINDNQIKDLSYVLGILAKQAISMIKKEYRE